MPSRAFLEWNNVRLASLTAVETQCAATFASAVPPPPLADENLRGFVLLLSAHFQGFCRDLHTECIQIVAAATPVPMQFMMQRQCSAARQLDGGNVKYESIRKDFDRFGLDLSAALGVDKHGTNLANKQHVTEPGRMNDWRNYAAHHNQTAPTGTFTQASVIGWRNSCSALAAELDGAMYNQLQALTGAPPW